VHVRVHDHGEFRPLAAQLVTDGWDTAAPGGALSTSFGSWPRSCRSTIAALRPGAPVMEPPGWLDPPVWYRPGMGMRWEAQPGKGDLAH
jgi:hypothetical protein